MRLSGTIFYNKLSVDLGGFRERLAAGAFDAYLSGKDNDVLARHEHDSRLLLGRRGAGTLELRQDRDALRWSVDLPDTQAGRDVAALARSRDVAGSSFAFIIRKPEDEAWDVERDGSIIRTILRADLLDVSSVALGAYPSASVQEGRTEPVEQSETLLRWDVGAPRRPIETLRLRNRHAGVL